MSEVPSVVSVASEGEPPSAALASDGGPSASYMPIVALYEVALPSRLCLFYQNLYFFC